MTEIYISKRSISYFEKTMHRKFYHRLDGAAIEWDDGYKAWYKYDALHREDGPAIIENDGAESYFLNGQELSHDDFKKKIEKL